MEKLVGLVDYLLDRAGAFPPIKHLAFDFGLGQHLHLHGANLMELRTRREHNRPGCAGLRSSRPQSKIAVRMTANPAPAGTPNATNLLQIRKQTREIRHLRVWSGDWSVDF
jgi:hypothetical protein